MRLASTEGHESATATTEAGAASAPPFVPLDPQFFDDQGQWRPEALLIFPWSSSTAVPSRVALQSLLRHNALDREKQMSALQPPVLELPTSSKQRRHRAKTLGETASPRNAVAAMVQQQQGASDGSGMPGPQPATSLTISSSSAGSHISSPDGTPSHLGSRSPPVMDTGGGGSGGTSRASSAAGSVSLVVTSPSMHLASIQEESTESVGAGMPPPAPLPLALSNSSGRAGRSSPRLSQPPPASADFDRSLAARSMIGMAANASSSAVPLAAASQTASASAASLAGSPGPSGMVSPRAGSPASMARGVPTTPTGSMSASGGGGLFSLRSLRERLRGSNPPSPSASGVLASAREDAQPRAVRLLFSKATTSARDPQYLILDLEAALINAGVLFERTAFVFLCKAGEACFEIEICKVPRLALRALRFKRLDGDSWRYKAVCTRIIEQLKL